MGVGHRNQHIVLLSNMGASFKLFWLGYTAVGLVDPNKSDRSLLVGHELTAFVEAVSKTQRIQIGKPLELCCSSNAPAAPKT